MYGKTGKIKEELYESCIWVPVDERTGVNGSFVAHFLAWKLAADEKTRVLLVCSKPLWNTNEESVARVVNQLKVVYPTGVEGFTDTAGYMRKASCSRT